MSKPILKLTTRDIERLEAAKAVMAGALLTGRIKGDSKEAAALRETLRDGEALIRRIYQLAALPA